MDERRQEIINNVFLTVAIISVVALLVALFIPVTQGYNPFRLLFGDGYSFIEREEERDTNVLRGLLGASDPELYPIEISSENIYLTDSRGKEDKSFLECNSYKLYVEAYNEPHNSDRNIEIYGAFGIEFLMQKKKLSEREAELLDGVKEAYPDSIIVPYYTYKTGGVRYLSCIDISGSQLLLERVTDGERVEISSVSGAAWRKIYDKNGGVAVLRNNDGSLIFGAGEYQLTVRLKQLQVSDDGGLTVAIREPKTALYTFSVGAADTANGVLIASDAEKNMDFQLNAVNSDSAVCYYKGSKVTMDEGMKLGVSVSGERREKLRGISPYKLGASAKIEIYRYDFPSGEYVFAESRELSDVGRKRMNGIVTFDSCQYETGNYKIVFIYESNMEYIEQEYEYYLVFEN